MRKYFVPVLAALAMAGVSAPASAGEVTITVNHADLDLTKESDVEVLKRRLVTAARTACRNSLVSNVLSLHSVSDCNSELIEGGLEQIEQRRALELEAAQTATLAAR